ncbi:hypothetical protein GOP47_0006084 [Adiantum capillus-veneris]|uniref:Uncharacterized protein n=1 Tax=Adiantum capillus-veneris TaxID=13818 RepID=A0A9D4ZJZ7_ADICA|nr:hypothetical protein GOP47_0006084 [Adiantum capillus-veneris]
MRRKLWPEPSVKVSATSLPEEVESSAYVTVYVQVRLSRPDVRPGRRSQRGEPPMTSMRVGEREGSTMGWSNCS